MRDLDQLLTEFRVGLVVRFRLAIPADLALYQRLAIRLIHEGESYIVDVDSTDESIRLYSSKRSLS